MLQQYYCDSQENVKVVVAIVDVLAKKLMV